MSKEIKEKIDKSKENHRYNITSSREWFENLLDYITNLQQENKQLKEDKKKAIEYIKENTKNDTFCEWYDGEVKDLLEILGDKENE